MFESRASEKTMPQQNKDKPRVRFSELDQTRATDLNPGICRPITPHRPAAANLKQMSSTQLLDQDVPNPEHSRLLDRRLAAAYVGVTAGLFERLAREQVIPEPVFIGRKPLWSTRLLDGCLDAIRRTQSVQTTEAGRPPANRPLLLGQEQSVAREAATVLPDQEWLRKREDLVRRVHRSPLSQHELSILCEFNVLQSREVSMFGCYRTFEALMARGLVVELSRSGPFSRPLVAYRLTDDGARIAASIRDDK